MSKCPYRQGDMNVEICVSNEIIKLLNKKYWMQ